MVMGHKGCWQLDLDAVNNIWDQQEITKKVETYLGQPERPPIKKLQVASASMSYKHGQKRTYSGQEKENNPLPEAMENNQTVQEVSIGGVKVQVNFDKVDTATSHTTEFQQPVIPDIQGGKEMSTGIISQLIKGLDDGLVEEPLKEHIKLWCESGQSEEENMSDIDKEDVIGTIEGMLGCRNELEPLPPLGGESQVALEKARQ
ncbi:hypothetical protein FRC17_007019 [Serendipita sp. 399]|nr:hypothetical protein FRC17_007019 [Serendipita sp. 399]